MIFTPDHELEWNGTFSLGNTPLKDTMFLSRSYMSDGVRNQALGRFLPERYHFSLM